MNKDRRGLRLVVSHGLSTGPPVERVDDLPLRKIIDSLTQGRVSRPYWRYVFTSEEGEALFQVLRGQVYAQERLQDAIEFLWKIDPLQKSRGWSDERLNQYVRQASMTLERRVFAEKLLEKLQESIKEVRERTKKDFFRRSLLCAALFFFATGYQEEETPERATG